MSIIETYKGMLFKTMILKGLFILSFKLAHSGEIAKLFPLIDKTTVRYEKISLIDPQTKEGKEHEFNTLDDVLDVARSIFFAEPSPENYNDLLELITKLENKFSHAPSYLAKGPAARLDIFYEKFQEELIALRKLEKSQKLLNYSLITPLGLTKLLTKLQESGVIPRDLETMVIPSDVTWEKKALLYQRIKALSPHQKMGVFYFTNDHAIFLWIVKKDDGSVDIYNFDSLGNVYFHISHIHQYFRAIPNSTYFLSAVNRQRDARSCVSCGLLDIIELSSMLSPVKYPLNANPCPPDKSSSAHVIKFLPPQLYTHSQVLTFFENLEKLYKEKEAIREIPSFASEALKGTIQKREEHSIPLKSFFKGKESPHVIKLNLAASEHRLILFEMLMQLALN